MFGLTIQCATGKSEVFRIHMLTRGDTQLRMWFKAMWENAKVLESKLEITRYIPTQEAYFFLILEYNATRALNICRYQKYISDLEKGKKRDLSEILLRPKKKKKSLPMTVAPLTN